MGCGQRDDIPKRKPPATGVPMTGGEGQDG